MDDLQAVYRVKLGDIGGLEFLITAYSTLTKTALTMRL